MERLEHDAIVALLERDGIIENTDISDLDPSRADLDEPRFTGCTVEDTRWSGGALASSRWRDCKFLGADLVSVDLQDAAFTHCAFFNAEHHSAFKFCDMGSARFTECDLSMVSFDRCDLYNVGMTGCRLRGAQFSGSAFTKKISTRGLKASAQFRQCDLSFTELSKQYLAGCVFEDCSFQEANLSNSVLRSAEMAGADLTNAQLDSADLSGADLRGGEVAGVRLFELLAYTGMMISADQQHNLLREIGIDVYPD